MNLMQLWNILRARRRMFVALAGGVAVLVLLVSLLIPATYIAETSLVVDTKSTDPVSGNAVPGQLAATIIATQTDIIESHSVALKVVDKLGLTKDPALIAKFESATGGHGSLRDWLADRLDASVLVRPSRDSNVINIDYPARDPASAARIANAFADAYVDESIELQVDPARRASHWYDEELQNLRARLDAAQQRLAEQQRKSNLLLGDQNHVDVDTAKLAEISTELAAAQQALYDSKARLQQMNHALAAGSIDALPDVLQDPLLQTLKTDLARAESNLAEVSARYGRNHPTYQSAAATVHALRAKIAAELQSVQGSIVQSAQLHQRDVDQLQQALAEQKTALLDAQSKHDSLSVLNRDVDAAQRTYDAALQRAGDVRLTSRLDQSTVSVLTPASPPFEPARPKVLLYTLMGAFFGSILAAGACIGAELLDRRVRTPQNISEEAGLLVLAEIPRLGFDPSGPRRLRLT